MEGTWVGMWIMFTLLSLILIGLKVGMDKLGIKVVPEMFARFLHGKENAFGPSKAFRYVFAFNMKGYLNKYILTIVGAIILSFIAVVIKNFDNIILYLIIYVVYILVIQLFYAFKVHNMSK